VDLCSAGGRAPSNGAIWNPHSTIRLILVAMSVAVQASPGIAVSLALRRSSTRGTPTVTITPDIDSSWERDKAPAAAPLIDLQYSALPTLDASILDRFHVVSAAPVVSTGFDKPMTFPGLIIPPGTGFVFGDVLDTTAVVADWTFTWRDEG